MSGFVEQEVAMLRIEEQIGSLYTAIMPVGSRVTCDPAPTGTDRDWLVLVDEEKWVEFCDGLLIDGWFVGGSEIMDAENSQPPDMQFRSFMLGEENIIATKSEIFFRRFAAATSVAKRLNLLDKNDRIALFQAVLYANGCDQ